MGDTDLDVVVEGVVWKNIETEENIQKGLEYANAFRSIMKDSKKTKFKMNFSAFTEDTDIDKDTDVSQLAETASTDMEIDD